MLPLGLAPASLLLLGERWVLVRHEGKFAAVRAIRLPAEPVLDAVFVEGVEALQR